MVHGGQGQYVTDTTTTLSARGGAGKNGKGGGGGGTATYGVSHMDSYRWWRHRSNAAPSGDISATNAAANSGAGGGAVTLGLGTPNSQTVTSGAGGSGWLRVVWFE